LEFIHMFSTVYRALGFPADRTNPNGGAIALGLLHLSMTALKAKIAPVS
jgi:acetyl-CoA acetyltransferase